MAAVPDPKPTRRRGGLDLLRLGAMALVTVQHALSLTDHDHWSSYRSLNVGQVGVAIFLAISALLASQSHRRPLPWLGQRLWRIYPTYWIAMIPCFVIARATGYKDFSPAQFLSQMMGLGLFTHPDNLINVPTWFISILLVCYVGLFAGRLMARPLLMDLLLVLAIFCWWTPAEVPWPWFHLITFFGASAVALACPAERSAAGFLVAGIIALVAAPWSIALAYTGIAFLSIGVSSLIWDVPRSVTRLAENSYEYYLLHGVFLVGAISSLPDHPAFAIPCGVVLALLASILLNRFARWVMGRVVC